MKGLAVLALLCSTLAGHAQSDAGGRDISVALFSARPAETVSLAAAGPGAWWARCAQCTHQPLTAVLHVPALQEVFAGGPITVRDEEHAEVRTANGGWHLRRNAHGEVDVFLTLPSERYVAAVLMAEAGAGEPRESLLAMAVVARTLALRSAERDPAGKRNGGQAGSDVCDSTACQAIKLGPVSDAVDEAVRSTAGETLWFGAARAEVFFSQSCGGTTESGGSAWPKLASVPYLQSAADPYCIRKDRASWHADISLDALGKVAAAEGWRLPQPIVNAQIAERTPSQRARTIAFLGRNGDRAAVSASSLRLAVGRSLGWSLLRSDAYDLHLRDGALVFDGRGHGHGVGLCQQGATEMARMGKSYREILAFYFRGTSVRILSADRGWRQAASRGVTLRSTADPAPVSAEDAAAAWAEAESRFPPLRPVAPAITFALTTELFRQLTNQPGWQLASTSGSTIVLLPAAIFAKNHVAMQHTLLHEMLHVAVEAGSNPRAPLWLREGLVEELAGDAPHGMPALSAERTEQLLHYAASRPESESAHLAAGARARLLVARYGLSAVRGWLRSGAAPPPV